MKKSSFRASLAAAGIIASSLGLLSAAPAQAGTPTEPRVSVSTQRQQVLDGLNAWRAQSGLPALGIHAGADTLAQDWANQRGAASPTTIGRAGTDPNAMSNLAARGCAGSAYTNPFIGGDLDEPYDGDFAIKRAQDLGFRTLVETGAYKSVGIGISSVAGPVEGNSNVIGKSVYWTIYLCTAPANVVVPTVKGPIATTYGAIGGAGAIGTPTANEFGPLKNGGVGQTFTGGSIYWSPATGGAAVKGAIRDKWGATGYENGFLGYPLGSEFAVNGGAGQHFQGGSVYWSSATGAQVVRGALKDTWAQRGWERSAVGFPTAGEFGPLVSGGFGQHFQGGSIYWSPANGGALVRGAVKDKWATTGWEKGFLGYPRGDDFGQLKNGGTGQHFQGGSIYWSPATGSATVRGALRDKWAATGYENGALGYPTGDEFGIRGGFAQHFQGGTLYYSATTGTNVVKGSTFQVWGQLGYENGALGYPTGDQFGIRDGGTVQRFERGLVYSSFAGTYAVSGSVLTQYAARGYENGALGYPTSAFVNGQQSFERGTLR